MSLLSDLNEKIKKLSTRVGTEVKSLWEGVTTAQADATSAKTTAETANSTASTAKSTADTANSTATTALSTANAKVSKSGDTMTGAITTAVNDFIQLARDSGDTYGVRCTRTDTGNEIAFGVGSGGQNRGIWDTSTNQWMIAYDSNGYLFTKATRFVLGNGSIWIA